MDLRVAGVGEESALAVSPPRGGDVARHGVGGQVVDVAVATGGQHDSVSAVGVDFTGEHVAGDDPAGLAVLGDDVEHIGAVVEGDLPRRDLGREGLVGT